MRCQRICQHVGPIGVAAPVVPGSRLPLGVGFDQESAEVWHPSVDLRRLVRPPLLDLARRRIGGAQSADLDRRAETSCEVDGDPVGPEHVCQGRHLVQVLPRQNLSIRIHVGEHGPIDADGRIRSSVVRIARRERSRQRVPIPEGAAGVASLDAAIEVVPMVENAVLDLGVPAQREPLNGPVALQVAQQGETAIEHSHVGVGGNHDQLLSVGFRGFHQVALGTQGSEARGQRQGGHDGRRCRRSKHHRPVAGRLRADGHRRARQTSESVHQLVLGDLQRGRCTRLYDVAESHLVLGESSGENDFGVTQPKLRSVLVRQRPGRWRILLIASHATAGASAGPRGAAYRAPPRPAIWAPASAAARRPPHTGGSAAHTGIRPPHTGGSAAHTGIRPTHTGIRTTHTGIRTTHTRRQAANTCDRATHAGQRAPQADPCAARPEHCATQTRTHTAGRCGAAAAIATGR